MILWAAAAALLAVALAAVLYPLLRVVAPPARRAEFDLAVYRDQLAEIEREITAGALSAAQAAAARAEIGRRMIAVAADPRPARDPGPAARRTAVLPLLLAAALPVAALSLYLWLGAPGLPGVPFAERQTAADQADMAVLVERLAQRMRERPDDAQGWALLARSYQGIGRTAEAVEAYGRAVALKPRDAEMAASFGELLVERAGGTVTPDARSQFQAALKAAPRDPRARFYLGLAQAQAGDAKAALQAWTDLLALAPPDAPWRSMVEARIRETAAIAKIDPAAIVPSDEAARLAPARGPGQAEVEAARSMAPEERTRMIRGMVDSLAARLEAEPNDVEGWRRLARARGVLGERDAALAAHAKAAALAPDRIDVLGDYAGALVDGLAPEASWPPKFFELQRQILALTPDDPEAKWFVALEAAQAKGPAAVLAHWEVLRDRYPAGTAERTEIERRIARLKAMN